MADLRGRYDKSHCILAGTGPSIASTWTPEVEQRAASAVVIGLKRAVELNPALFDFLIVNGTNDPERYALDSATIVLAVWQATSAAREDILLPLDPVTQRLELSAINLQFFDRYQMMLAEHRCSWGPGLMFEIGLYLPVLLGCSSIEIHGFDGPTPTRSHFYDDVVDPIYESLDRRGIIDQSAQAFRAFIHWAGKRNVKVWNASPNSRF